MSSSILEVTHLEISYNLQKAHFYINTISIRSEILLQPLSKSMHRRLAKSPSFRFSHGRNAFCSATRNFVLAGYLSKDLTDEYKVVREQDFRQCAGTMSSVVLTLECDLMSCRYSVSDISLVKRTRRKQAFRLLRAS